MKIFCCGCGHDVEARLTDGTEIYPHRPDLSPLPFWRCDLCKNFVGCHHKTANHLQPLGCIPTPELREARKKLHALIDPIWQSGHIDRKQLYAEISKGIGWNYHTAKTRSLDEAHVAYKVVERIKENLT